jgi:DNA-binding CsgD family transcriptional regulator
MSEKKCKKQCNFRGDKLKLTNTEQEVLYLLTNEFLTPKQITIRRQTKVSAVYNTLRSLKKKGVINDRYQIVEKNQMHFYTFLHNQVRLHAQEFNINILFKDKRYQDLRAKNNIVIIDGNTIRLNKNSIEVYSGMSFFGKTANKAYSKSVLYFKRLFAKIENDLKIIIVKDRKFNIKEVYSEYSETNNELSKDMEKKGEKLKVLANEDKKTWLKVDNSFNLHEMETCHPETAKSDMEDNIKPFFNDLRDNRPPKISEVMMLIKEMAEQNKETASGLNAIATYLNTQIPKNKETDIKRSMPEYIG